MIFKLWAARRQFIIRSSLAAVIAVLGLPAAQAYGSKPPSGTSSASLAADPGLHHGLASKYPGDVGLASDSAVVFSEDFEQGAVSDVSNRWTSTNNKDESVLSLITENAPGSPGKRSLMMTGTKGHDTGGDLWKRLDKGYDQLYARFYVKFAPDAPYVHHFVALGGKTSTAPYPEGSAGIRPTGYNRFGTSMDLGRTNADPPGAWFFYTYWCEMRSWQTEAGEPDGRPNPYYGNGFGPDVPEQAKRGEWQCVELMIKLNSAPDKRDGEQAFWVDGKLVSRWATGTYKGTWFRDSFHRNDFFDTNPQPFEGFLWSKTEELKINYFWLQYYLASVFEENLRPANPDILYNDNVARVQFDNVVLATRYIGPIATAADSSETGFDFNRDGRASTADVIQMLKMRQADPQDMRTDYNGDGRLTLLEVLDFLLDVLRGKVHSG